MCTPGRVTSSEVESRINTHAVTYRHIEELAEVCGSLVTAGPALEALVEHRIARVVAAAVCAVDEPRNQELNRIEINPSALTLGVGVVGVVLAAALVHASLGRHVCV